MNGYTQNNHVHGGQPVIFQGAGTVNVHQWQPAYRIEEFPAGPQRIRPREPAAQPSQLLLSRHQAVPFTGRQAETDSLLEWRDDSEEPGLAVRLLYGPGGQGKTRLAGHFAELSRRSGWAVWQAEQQPGRHGRAAPPVPDAAAGILVVVDYAERWSVDALCELFEDPALFHRGAPVRLLLLSRTAGLWWQALAGWLRRRLDVVAGASRLAPLADRPALRTELFEQARDRFAALLGLPEDQARTVAPPPALAEGKEYAQVLTIHAAALAAVDALKCGDEPPADPIRASARLLEREIEHWVALHRRTPDPLGTDPETMRKAVLVATLTRPQEIDDAYAAMRRTDLADSNAVAQRILSDHNHCYPPRDASTVMEPLYPDRLGEDFLGLAIVGHGPTNARPDAWAARAVRLLLTGRDAGVPTAGLSSTLTVLIETARRWPEVATGHLNPLLTAHPEVALEAGSAALIALADLGGVGIDVLDAIDEKLPKAPHTDLDVGAAAVVRRTAAHYLAITEEPANRARIFDLLAKRLSWAMLSEEAVAASREAVALLRGLADGDPSAHEPALADALDQLGVCLAELGHDDQALAVTAEALALHRRLAAADPQAYEADRARSLANLGARLADVGRHDEALAAAEEAAPVYRRLAAADPSHEKDFVTTLINLGSMRSKMGLRGEALVSTEEAVALGRRLAAADPQSYGPLLALALGNLGVQLAAVGRWQEARQAAAEAVELRRGQAGANPQAGNPDLARNLSNLAVDAGQLGDRAEARRLAAEAVEIYRRLVENNPRRYEPGLAQSLNNLGAVLNDRTMGEESVAIWRRLAAASPQAHLPGLAEALITFGALLAHAGRRVEALDTTEEATALYRELAAANPRVHQPALAKVLANLVKQLLDGGRPVAEALAAGEESVALWRALTADDPRAHEPDLAVALLNLGAAYQRAGRSEEALATTEEAVARRRRLVAADPQAHEPDLAMALNNLAGSLPGVGRGAEALAAAEESVARYRRLAEADPLHEPQLARALGTLAEVGGGLPAGEEAVAVCRRLAARNPEAHEPELARLLGNLAHLLVPAGRPQDVLAASEEAVALSRRLVAAGLSAHLPVLANGVLNHGVALSRVARPQEALAAYQEAVALTRVAVERHGREHERLLALALGNLGGELLNAGRPGEARAALEEAVLVLRSVLSHQPAHEPLLITALKRLGFLYYSTQAWPELVEVATELVARHRRLAVADPGAYEPALADWLADLAVGLWRVGRLDEALETGARSADVYRRLAAGAPEAFQEQLRTVEAARAKGLERVGRGAEAAEIRARLGHGPGSPAEE
ncbi:tetratricopeptide repeat protein [Kitasatospora sp. RB6PN24]|uniref:tetratricopeptide repeat protein n=1 Tax=Kitasatospora humi TaxID=2893891 RepID=UPI001E4C9B5E|nr:tetratricopeptide repeat protein [Kitasatospora humi]MCC9311275.1 tetratricopeptide repeat protein [Kitasatospora humi]